MFALYRVVTGRWFLSRKFTKSENTTIVVVVKGWERRPLVPQAPLSLSCHYYCGLFFFFFRSFTFICSHITIVHHTRVTYILYTIYIEDICCVSISKNNLSQIKILWLFFIITSNFTKWCFNFLTRLKFEL